MIPATASAQKHFPITKYGASPDSVLNTRAIQQAIDQCSAAGGGTVVVPAGAFRTGAIFLKTGVNLEIEKGGVIKGSINMNDYPQVDTRWEGVERTWTSALVNITGLEGTRIYGAGTIDGSGDTWQTRGKRPRLICFQNCKNVSISGLQLHNQAVWCLHILYSHNVLAKNLHITAAHNIPSSDGIDIDSSDSVRVTGTFIDVNDDCISIKSGKDDDGRRVNRPSKNIRIDHCHLAYGHGGVAMGSEVSGGISQVLISDCLIDSGNWAPIRFKSQPSRGGIIEDITYQNITLNQTKKAVEFNMAWRMVGPAQPPAKVPTIVRNILIKNVSGNVETVGDMTGLDNSPISGVKFVNCHIQANTGLKLHQVMAIDTSGLHVSGVLK